MNQIERREIQIFFDAGTVRAENRTVEASISSEYPYPREQGNEILVHTKEAIDLSRGPDLPLLLQHNNAEINVGLVTNIRLVGKKLKATLKFGMSQRATDVWQDVKAGILKFMSVAYSVIKKTATDESGNYYVTRWQPYEASIVSVAADPMVGIGRSATKEINEERKDNDLEMRQNHATKEFWQQNSFRDLAEQFRAIRAVAEVGYTDPRLRATGLSASNDGLMIQPIFSNALISPPNVIEEWTRATKIQLGKGFNGVTLTAFHESSRETDSVLGGTKFYFVDEADQATASELMARQVQLKLKKAIATMYSTDELADDARVFNATVPAAIQTAFNAMLRDQINWGTGAGRPLGIMNSGCLITAPVEDGQDEGILSENILNMIKHLPGDSWQSPGLMWKIHKDAIPDASSTYKIVGTAGIQVPLWHWRTGGERFNKLCGIDVVVDPYAAPLNTAGDIMLCDMREYLICHKESRSSTSIHVRFVFGEEVYKMVFKWDGAPSWNQAVTPPKGSNKVSPFICLASRV